MIAWVLIKRECSLGPSAMHTEVNVSIFTQHWIEPLANKAAFVLDIFGKFGDHSS